MEADVCLEQFLLCHHLPQRVKVTDGYNDPNNPDNEFSNGDVLDLRQLMCPTVRLSFCHPHSGADVSCFVSTLSPNLFHVESHGSDYARSLAGSSTLTSVQDLVHHWPCRVKAGANYTNDELECGFSKGQTVKLSRLVMRRERPCLEVRIQSSLNFAYLPMDCIGKFQVLRDHREYTLSEIAKFPAKSKWRLRLSGNEVNRKFPIQGVPVGFRGDLHMDCPQKYVEISPVESPGTVFVVPMETDITVSARPEVYAGPMENWYDLNVFVQANETLFPVVARLMHWEEGSTILENMGVGIGDELVLHRLDSRQRVLCEGRSCAYVIPESFGGKWQLQATVFEGIEKVVSSGVREVFVRAGDTPHDPSVAGTQRGQRIRILGSQSYFVKVKVDGATYNEVEVIDAFLVGGGTQEQLRLPLYLGGSYQEVLPSDQRTGVPISKLTPSHIPANVNLEFSEYEDPDSFLPEQMLDPEQYPMQIKGFKNEECVLVAKFVASGAPRSFYLPTRTNIQVAYKSRFPKTTIPQKSSVIHIPEEVTHDAFEKLVAESSREPSSSRLPTVKPKPSIKMSAPE